MTLRPRVDLFRWRRRPGVRHGAVCFLVLSLTISCAHLARNPSDTSSPGDSQRKAGRISRWLAKRKPAPKPPGSEASAQILPPLVGSVALPAIPPHPDESSTTRPTAAASTPTTAAQSAERILASLLVNLATATEENNSDLRAIDVQIEQINSEMTDIYHSEGWELELESRQVDVDSTRRDTREGRTQRLDGTYRRAHRFFGDLDEDLSEFIIRLQRSWGHPDHEKYVEIALKRLEKFDAVIRKQDLRRDLHLTTLDAVLDVVSRQAVLPLMEERIELVRQKVEKLQKYRDEGEALLEDLLDARRDLERLRVQSTIHKTRLDFGFKELGEVAEVTHLQSLTTLPLSVNPTLLTVDFDGQEATSRALARRLDYHLGEMRVTLTDTLAKYMAWYWPTLDFKIWWNDFHGHRTYLDEHRRDKGDEFGTELMLGIPLNAPARGRARQQAFRAQRERFAIELQTMRTDIAGKIRGAYLERLEAHALVLDARDVLEHAEEKARATGILAETLPAEIQGIPEIVLIESAADVVAARMTLLLAEHKMFQAQAHWNYLVGDSPIDTAVSPFLARERRAVEKRKWLQWWTSLIK